MKKSLACISPVLAVPHDAGDQYYYSYPVTVGVDSLTAAAAVDHRRIILFGFVAQTTVAFD